MSGLESLRKMLKTYMYSFRHCYETVFPRNSSPFNSFNCLGHFKYVCDDDDDDDDKVKSPRSALRACLPAYQPFLQQQWNSVSAVAVTQQPSVSQSVSHLANDAFLQFVPLAHTHRPSRSTSTFPSLPFPRPTTTVFRYANLRSN